MQARCSKAASKLETCFLKLSLEPDDTTVFNAERPGTRPGWLHISHSGLGIHTPIQTPGFCQQQTYTNNLVFNLISFNMTSFYVILFHSNSHIF